LPTMFRFRPVALNTKILQSRLSDSDVFEARLNLNITNN
jgi:hypothetical protein